MPSNIIFHWDRISTVSMSESWLLWFKGEAPHRAMMLHSSRGSGSQSCESLLAHLFVTSVLLTWFFRWELEEPLRKQSLCQQGWEKKFSFRYTAIIPVLMKISCHTWREIIQQTWSYEVVYSSYHHKQTNKSIKGFCVAKKNIFSQSFPILS